MATHNPRFEKLVDLVEGRLTNDEAERIAAQIKSSSDLHVIHLWLRDFVAQAEQTTLVAPPATTRAALSDLLPPRNRASDARDRVVEHIGRLIRDVRAGPAFAGARGAVVDSGRQLLFDIGDDTDVMVQLQTGASEVRVSGQVLGDDPVRQLRLLWDDSSIELDTDEFGEFSTTVPTTTSLQMELASATQRARVDLTLFLDSAVHGTA